MSIFDYSEYKAFALSHLAEMPKAGRGEFKRMAEHLSVHPTMISHIFRGDSDLTLEQATALTDYLGLRAIEAEYFVDLVQLARAGTQPLKKMIHARLERQRENAQQIETRLQPQKVLDERDRALFYSEWHFSAIRLLTAIPEYHDVDRIAQRLQLPRALVAEIVDFLLEVGLCRQVDGKLTHAVQTTHVAAGSPLVNRHHKNWRLKALERLPKLGASELAFTMPVALSRDDVMRVRKLIVDFIAELDPVFDASASETLACLNVDWVLVD